MQWEGLGGLLLEGTGREEEVALVMAQLSLADRLILNKTDLVGAGSVEALRETLARTPTICFSFGVYYKTYGC